MQWILDLLAKMKGYGFAVGGDDPCPLEEP